ncbi:unnamed protein product [Schistosoma margrebowiei]|uniref:Uncharacterized protein n=1 Tax=Schistosoma margrebowiei TaxID=48269 RepID=A0A183LQD1_9TREM|nr:unnamed protein product [Schistosoma margrebowiei]
MREVVNFSCFLNKLQGSEIQEQDVLYKKLVITVKGHEPMVLKSYETFVKQVCDNLSIALISNASMSFAHTTNTSQNLPEGVAMEVVKVRQTLLPYQIQKGCRATVIKFR